MGRCPYSRVTLTKDGGRFVSRFCKLHCCKKIDNNAACTNMRTNNRGYCQQHLLCTGTLNDQRCTNYIRNYDPKEFRFCSQYPPGCAHERNHPNGVDYKYCRDHRCDHVDCPNPKASPSPFCASHTCASPACLAGCPGATGDPHDPSRYCDRHRMCATANCRRFAHLDAHGVPSRHCGAHFCRFEGGCDAERVRGAEETCAAHTCEEPGCVRARNHRLERARYCKTHECDIADCWNRRWLGDFCPAHQCARPGCNRKGEFAHYCDRHRICNTPGCDRFRLVDGENVKDMCEEHSITRCRRADCDARVVAETPLCANHLCAHRACHNERYQFSEHCADHKCAVTGCFQLRAPMVLSQTMMMFGGGGGVHGRGGINWPLSPYCTAHMCRHEACTERSADNSHFCLAHARCRRPGCANGVDARAQDPTLCAEHNRSGAGGMGRRGVLNNDGFGYGGGGGSGWPGLGAWGVNAAI
ncbi:hypothetical protein EsH8_II_000183 [Colletotrichum jinshuiense]